ncbi:MAG: VTT domain-containing protein [Methanobacteriaceae archaeon]|nr:VTT domain-containing protein [Methanobacteriaceae archaeon]MDP3034696.1 VTT domain-containing protein [Methanobacteriaceae archaeon]MDP3485291.1 VTT domain-containing protein [Methanobacteriaceae archaeon]MDP3624272.1 VTT domain-containing protein [Methanobacteriaceae archaeon]
MFTEVILYLESILLVYGPFGVFLASIIEEIIAPIPSTMVIMGTSFIVLKGTMITPGAFFSLFINVVLPAALGVTIGSLFVYAIAYFAGKPFLERWGKYLGISWEDIEKAENKFEKSNSDTIVLFGVRAIPIIPSVAISAFCGFIRFNVKEYIIITFLGTLVRASILGFIGWQFGSLYQTAANEISYIEEISLSIIIIIAIVYIIYKKKSKKDKLIK